MDSIHLAVVAALANQVEILTILQILMLVDQDLTFFYFLLLEDLQQDGLVVVVEVLRDFQVLEV